ncbi:MFS transporter [Salinicola salarius]|uniref:MFS transporter n=1 Tax=Salinicola salarius TaxID=430457 RepID=UPI000DA21874|nr:MFS transporter [Salinicola salarius]
MEERVIRKVFWRTIPLLALCYLIAFIDKTNIGFAQLGMRDDIGLGDAAFGLGAGVFFIGYFLCEVPSNLALARFGARTWIMRIMVSWGLVVMLTALVQGSTSFTIMRFLLGAAEAGFYPGVLYYLSTWCPERHRPRLIGMFLLANPMSTIVGGPICGALLEMEGIWGLSGWQWLFVLSGLPAVLLGFVVFRYLPGSPEDVDWLDADERRWLISTLDEEQRHKEIRHTNPLKALKEPKLLFLAAMFLAYPTAAYGLRLWLPTLIDAFEVSDFTNGMLNAVPFVFAAIGLYVWPRYIARDKPVYPHLLITAVIGAIGLIATASTSSHVLQMAFLSLAAFGLFAGEPLYWSIPSRILVGANAAAGLALINSIGNLGGFIGPWTVGVIRESTGELAFGMYFLAGVLIYAGIMGVIAGIWFRRQ